MSPTSRGSDRRSARQDRKARLPGNFPYTLDQLHASPIYRHFGIEVLRADRTSARVRLAAREEHKNIQGVYHGGTICTAADSAGALAAMSAVAPDRTVSSIDLKVNFLAAVTGGPLDAAAKVIHAGRRTIVCDIDVTQGKRLVAKALATYAVLDGEAIARVQRRGNGHARP